MMVVTSSSCFWLHLGLCSLVGVSLDLRLGSIRPVRTSLHDTFERIDPSYEAMDLFDRNL